MKIILGVVLILVLFSCSSQIGNENVPGQQLDLELNELNFAPLPPGLYGPSIMKKRESRYFQFVQKKAYARYNRYCINNWSGKFVGEIELLYKPPFSFPVYFNSSGSYTIYIQGIDVYGRVIDTYSKTVSVSF